MTLLNTISENAWKWRHNISNAIKSSDRTLVDFAAQPESIESEASSTVQAEKEDRLPRKDAASKPKDPGLGSSVSVKTLYEGPQSHAGSFNWVEYPPKQLSKTQAKAQNRVAIKAYKIKDNSKPTISGRAFLKYHMIEIQSPLLMVALNEALQDQELHMDANAVASFTAPFQPLFFGYERIVAKAASLGDGDPLQPFLLLLIRLLDEVFAETRAKLRHLRANGLVSFELAWTYFPRDTIVLAFKNGEALYKVEKTSYTSTITGDVMRVDVKAVQFNGESFIWEDVGLEIPKFSGNKPVVEMGKYPLEFHDDPRAVEERLTIRGRKVLDYQGLTHCNYSGIALHNGMKRRNVDCRILVDIAGYNKHQLAEGPREKASPEYKRKVIRDTNKNGLLPGSNPALPVVSNDTRTGDKNPASARLSEEEQAKNKRILLSREHDLKFISPLVQGYAMKNKLWMSFFVDDIRPISWNDEAYDHLVYDEQQKDLVMSFVESHDAMRSVVKDVIVGKGEGLIVLLSGPPGTGKTLMAEAVADRAHRPLFYLQAEDLGITADVLGSRIKKVFEMATEWDAVILLDEADVFMAERDPHNITRNELVSIFLRELEYFRGIIFLTTNLYSTIDHAFRSRVSLHLLFPPLTTEARTVVWKKFPDKTAPRDGGNEVDSEDYNRDRVLGEDDIKELAAWELNGREIKNAVKMVKSWCDYKNYEMNLTRLENGIRVTSPHSSKRSGENDTSLYD